MRSSLFKLMTAAVILGVVGGCGGDRPSGEAAAPSAAPAEGSADVAEGSAMEESATAESSAADASTAEEAGPMD